MAKKNGRRVLPLVEIDWLDAITYTTCHAFEDIEKECPLAMRHTSGYLLHERTEDGRTIVLHTVDDVTPTEPKPSGADITVIPADWVKRIKYVRRPRGQKRAAKADPPQAPPATAEGGKEHHGG
jgi:hypothetical protein